MPIFAIFLALIAVLKPSAEPSAPAIDNLAGLPAQASSTTISGIMLWSMSPRAECERAEVDKAVSVPPYCNGLAARGEIPETPEQALVLARQIMINLQLAIGDNSYDTRASNPNLFPLVSLNFSRQLGQLTNYARMKSDRQSTLSYLDKRSAQQWIARDMAACALGGTVSGRIQDRGKIGQIDTGDLLSIGEFSCIDPRFSTAATPASFWLYEVTQRDYDQLKLKASGKMQRDLAGLSLQASIPETVFHMDIGQNPALYYKDASMSYCIGSTATESSQNDTDCDQLAVLFEHMNLTRADLDQGLHLPGAGRFSISFDRQLASQHGQAPSSYDITTNEVASWPGSVMPHKGTVIIMGRHDIRLILTFQNDGSVTMRRTLPGGTNKLFPTASATELFAYPLWSQDTVMQTKTPSVELKAEPASVAAP